MDLIADGKRTEGNVILLLPGSRKSANNDVKILLSAVEIMNSKGYDNFRMMLAPTLDYDKFFASCNSEGWTHSDTALTKDGVKISLTYDEISKASEGVCLLLGMGGTANQLCAGLGIPVIAPDNKGKRVQKKLLGDSEILTSGSAVAMAECALRVLDDERLYDYMSVTGRERMGVSGACDDVVKFALEFLGWRLRENVYKKLRD